jgi:O-antigen/teichoic acid export membrane protein
MALYSSVRARRSLVDTVRFRVLSQLASGAATIVLVRGISEWDFSTYSLLYATLPLFATFASLGIDQTLRRFQPEFLNSGATENSAWLVRLSLLLRLLSNLALIGIVLVAWSWLAPIFGIVDQRANFVIFGALLLLYFQVTLLQYALSSHMLHRFSMGAVALMSITKLLLYSVLMLGSVLTLTTAIVADICAYTGAFALMGWAYRKHGYRSAVVGGGAPGTAVRQRLRRFAGFSYLNDAASLLVYPETDRFFIAGVLGSLAVGAYAACTRVMDMIASLSPIKLLDSLVQPMFFAVPRMEAEQRLPRYFSFMINAGLAFQAPFIVFTAAFHAEILQLAFGGKYLDGSALLPLIVAFVTAELVFASPITMVAQYLERPSLVLYSQLTGLLQIVGMLLLLPRIGLAGAAISTGLFHVLRNTYVWWNVRAVARWLDWPRVLRSIVAIWAVVLAVCLLVKSVLVVPDFVLLLAGATVCAVGLLVHVRSNGFGDSDRQLLSSLLHGRESRLLRALGLAAAGR